MLLLLIQRFNAQNKILFTNKYIENNEGKKYEFRPAVLSMACLFSANTNYAIDYFLCYKNLGPSSSSIIFVVSETSTIFICVPFVTLKSLRQFVYFLSAEFVTSRRGHKQLIVDGYKFWVTRDKRRTTDKLRWTCTRKFVHNCRARLYTINDTIVDCFNDHNHPLSP